MSTGAAAAGLCVNALSQQANATIAWDFFAISSRVSVEIAAPAAPDGYCRPVAYTPAAFALLVRLATPVDDLEKSDLHFRRASYTASTKTTP